MSAVTAERLLVAWVRGSLHALPLLWIVAGLTWLVPLLSPRAAGHALYLVPLIAWPGLLLLTLASLAALALARRRELDRLGVPRLQILCVLQILLVAIVVIGSVPVLTFNLHPDDSIEATAIHPPFALAAAIISGAECLLLRRSRTAVARSRT